MASVTVQTRTPDAPPATERWKATAAVAVTIVLWASAFVAIRNIGHSLSPAPMALMRLAVAAVALSLLVLVRFRGAPRLPKSRRTLLLVAVYAVLWLAGYTVVLNAAEQHIDAGTAALLVNIAPLLIAFGAGLFLGEGYPKVLIIGSLVALGGLSLIALGSAGHRDWLGVVLCLVAAVLYAAGVLVQKATLRGVDGLIGLWLGCLVATAVLLPWAPQLLDELRTAPPNAILGTIYLGLFPTAIGFTTWSYALGRMSAGKLSSTTYVAPVVSVLLSWLLLGETPTLYALAGGAICLIGVAISRRPAK
ncbi:Threonine/homoserine efflux transporter RhtA [Saccharopolyspora kobensis]|uniref:Threonine/homoserine efflux transporter RhtA n=2 Tax=Saccharopolyspora kobensis TaxID=146035 RepID=A0A1H5UTX2_9PSEU|nr:DMT family transporter [Saccharopolyspora kobensis]SEF78446.1 Threonine/homoserine efflux transporter RhtA [Saccharopolyspora kobensis]SFC69276.1 Threonine/homoserine efflux transporter RhtA [Saccharopolyspora kobensis]